MLEYVEKFVGAVMAQIATSWKEHRERMDYDKERDEREAKIRAEEIVKRDVLAAQQLKDRKYLLELQVAEVEAQTRIADALVRLAAVVEAPYEYGWVKKT